MVTLTSQNGYSANDRSVIASLLVPGTTRRLAVRAGDVSVVLLDLAAWIHAHVRPIDVGVLDDWGYAERTIRGSSTTLSNHASGTAIDLDALLHPLGVAGTWTAAEKAAIHGRLAYYEGVVRWGEDYTGRLDGMHFEINAGAAAVRRIADKVRALGYAATPAARPSAPLPSPVPRQRPEDPDLMTPIDITINPDGTFRGAAVCEAGSSSSVIAEAWLVFGVLWGGYADALIAFLDDRGAVMNGGKRWQGRVDNNRRISLPVPDGCVLATVEGSVVNTQHLTGAIVTRPR
jgi:hypothetical protein